MTLLGQTVWEWLAWLPIVILMIILTQRYVGWQRHLLSGVMFVFISVYALVSAAANPWMCQ